MKKQATKLLQSTRIPLMIEMICYRKSFTIFENLLTVSIKNLVLTLGCTELL